MKKILNAVLSVSLLAAMGFMPQSDEASLLKKAEKIHDSVISVDTHTDTALEMLKPGKSHSQIQACPENLRKGRVDCCFYPIFVGQKALTDADRARAYDYAIGKMKGIREYIAKYPSQMEVAYSVADIERCKKEGKLSFIMGLENGFPVGTDIKKLQEFYDLGTRIITLCHNYHNDICDSSQDSVTAYHGLSEYGKEVVREMNRLGILVDISHASTETLIDCIQYSKAPVIASHSCVYALKDIKRNLKDAELYAIAANGGVVQVTSGRWALSRLPKEQVNISVFCDHVDYIKNLIGAQYVGIGTDFDGGGGMAQLEDASKMKYITVELLRRGWTQEELRLFWGGNILRVMRQVEKVAAEMSASK